MRWVGIFILVLLVVLLVVAAMNLLQGWLVDKFTSLGWMELTSLASGRWWGNIPSWALAVAAFLTFIVITRQIIQGRKSTNAQITVDFFRQSRGAEIVEKLRSIYALRPEDFENLPDNKRGNIDYVLDWFETLGALVNEKVVDQQLVIEIFAGLPALRCWYRLYEYIRKEQNKRGYYAENYEALARFSLDYFKKHGVYPKLYREGEENKAIDLLTELQKPQLRPRNLDEIKKDRKKKGK